MWEIVFFIRLCRLCKTCCFVVYTRQTPMLCPLGRSLLLNNLCCLWFYLWVIVFFLAKRKTLAQTQRLALCVCVYRSFFLFLWKDTGCRSIIWLRLDHPNIIACLKGWCSVSPISWEFNRSLIVLFFFSFTAHDLTNMRSAKTFLVSCLCVGPSTPILL